MPRKVEADPIDVVTKFVEAAGKVTDAVYIGIDPGASGAIGLLCNHLSAVIDIPVIKVERAGRTAKGNKKTTTLFDRSAIVEIFRLFRPVKARVCVRIERSQVQRKGKGASAYNGYRVGCAFAMWLLFIHAKGYGLGYEEVDPSTWKRVMGLIGKGKNASRYKAQGLWPNAPLARVADHDRAEALLLAEYARRQREAPAPKKKRKGQ